MVSVDVQFLKPDGGEETKTFSSRPLGMEFFMRMPMVVTKAKAASRELGVQKGWVIKAVGGESFDALDFASAYNVLKQATQPLKQEIVVREPPVDEASVASMTAKVGPVEQGEVTTYLKRFGYSASSHSAWEKSAPQPEIHLGVIDGHKELGAPCTHTWYALHCRLACSEANVQSFRWQVERRLAHLRACLHDPVKREIGKEYDNFFAGAHFAHHGGPPGTTARLEVWLGALAKLMNERKVTPSLVAATLRFLEAPDLSEAAKSQAVDLHPCPVEGSAAEGTPPTDGENGSPQASPAADGPKDDAANDDKTDSEEEAAGDGGSGDGSQAEPQRMSL